MTNNSGNPNPVPNPEIANIGKATQFGQPKGANPVECAKSEKRKAAYSIRSELKYISAQRLNIKPEEMANEELFEKAVTRELNKLRTTPEGDVTPARLGALKVFTEFVKSGAIPAANYVTENIEGKLSQEIVVPERRLAPTDNKTPEEAAAAYKEFIKI